MKLISKEYITDDVEYIDITVAVDHTFILSNNVVVHNCGVGFSVERQFIALLPEVSADLKHSGPLVLETGHQLKDTDDTELTEDNCIVVGDSKEGWADALGLMIDNLYKGIVCSIDITNVRPTGSPLLTFGGRSTDPMVLVDLFEYAAHTFSGGAGRKLQSIELHGVACKIAEIVICGSVRRCLPSGSKVHTINGLVSIEDISIGTKVLTMDGYYPVTNIFDQGVQEVITVHTANGSFQCTPNHRIAIITSGGYGWKQASTLAPGDILLSEVDNVPFKSIERCGITKHTWDIEVDVKHEFFCEGYLMHNSALISLSNLSDLRMARAKSGQWWENHPEYALANNSVAYTEKPDIEVFMKEWLHLVESKAGERGIFNRKAAQLRAAEIGRDPNVNYLVNPCFTGNMRLHIMINGVETPTRFDAIIDKRVLVVKPDGTTSEGKVWYSGIKEAIALTADGVTMICTPDQILLTTGGKEIKAKDALHLQLMPQTVRHTPEFNDDYKYGGSLALGDNVIPYTEHIFTNDTIAGLLTMMAHVNIAHVSLSLRDKYLLVRIREYLKTVDIESTVRYVSDTQYLLTITDYQSIVKYARTINFGTLALQNKLNKLITSAMPPIDRITSIGTIRVYDFSEPEGNWGIVNGLVAHNCGVV